MKFAIGIAILVSSVLWLGMSGYDEGKSYYKTTDEFVKLDHKEQSRRIRLMGNVSDGSIHREDGHLVFALTLNGATVPVVYHGTDPVPDTFKDGAQAMVDGSVGADGRFVGKQIQAKCASKYEADPKAAYSQAKRQAAERAPAAN